MNPTPLDYQPAPPPDERPYTAKTILAGMCVGCCMSFVFWSLYALVFANWIGKPLHLLLSGAPIIIAFKWWVGRGIEPNQNERGYFLGLMLSIPMGPLLCVSAISYGIS